MAAAVADVPGLEPRTLLTVSSDRLTVKLTREMWGTEASRVEVAQAISAVARERGASLRTEAPSGSPAGGGRQARDDRPPVSGAPSSATRPCTRTTASTRSARAPRSGCRTSIRRSPCATRCTSTSRSRATSAEARMQVAVAAGGRVVDDSGAPGAWILADRSGNKVCIAAWPDGAPDARVRTRLPNVLSWRGIGRGQTWPSTRSRTSIRPGRIGPASPAARSASGSTWRGTAAMALAASACRHHGASAERALERSRVRPVAEVPVSAIPTMRRRRDRARRSTSKATMLRSRECAAAWSLLRWSSRSGPETDHLGAIDKTYDLSAAHDIDGGCSTTRPSVSSRSAGRRRYAG